MRTGHLPPSRPSRHHGWRVLREGERGTVRESCQWMNLTLAKWKRRTCSVCVYVSVSVCVCVCASLFIPGQSCGFE